MYFTMRKPLFHFSPSRIFPKNMQKNDPKPRSEKKLEKSLSGDLFWDPKSIKIDVGAAGNRKNLQKMTKNEVPIFMQIFACEKNAKKRKKNEKTVPPAECAVPAGGKEGSKPSGVCETFCKTLHAVCLHAKNYAIEVMRWSLCKTIIRRSARHARVRRIQSLRAFRRHKPG